MTTPQIHTEESKAVLFNSKAVLFNFQQYVARLVFSGFLNGVIKRSKLPVSIYDAGRVIANLHSKAYAHSLTNNGQMGLGIVNTLQTTVRVPESLTRAMSVPVIMKISPDSTNYTEWDMSLSMPKHRLKMDVNFYGQSGPQLLIITIQVELEDKSHVVFTANFVNMDNYKLKESGQFSPTNCRILKWDRNYSDLIDVMLSPLYPMFPDLHAQARQ
mgnify:CR=1 FL=1